MEVIDFINYDLKNENKKELSETQYKIVINKVKTVTKNIKQDYLSVDI